MTKPSVLEVSAKYRDMMAKLGAMEKTILSLVLADDNHPELPEVLTKYRETVESIGQVRQKLHAVYPTLARAGGLPDPHPKRRK